MTKEYLLESLEKLPTILQQLLLLINATKENIDDYVETNNRVTELGDNINDRFAILIENIGQALQQVSTSIENLTTSINVKVDKTSTITEEISGIGTVTRNATISNENGKIEESVQGTITETGIGITGSMLLDWDRFRLSAQDVYLDGTRLHCNFREIEGLPIPYVHYVNLTNTDGDYVTIVVISSRSTAYTSINELRNANIVNFEDLEVHSNKGIVQSVVSISRNQAIISGFVYDGTSSFALRDVSFTTISEDNVYSI